MVFRVSISVSVESEGSKNFCFGIKNMVLFCLTVSFKNNFKNTVNTVQVILIVEEGF